MVNQWKQHLPLLETRDPQRWVEGTSMQVESVIPENELDWMCDPEMAGNSMEFSSF